MTEDHYANMRDAVADVLIGLASFCSAEGIDLDEEVEKTWALVKQRDWKANPDDAHIGLGDTQ
jgi:NTP pyrophosphatase (non-canonical NTP hydrolase)